MENAYSQTFSSVSSDEIEYYLSPKRVRIERSQKSIVKEEQQTLEQSIRCVNRYQTPPDEPMFLSETPNSWALGREGCDRARKTFIREFFHFQTYKSERLPCRVQENKLATEKWSPENEGQDTIKDDISLAVYGQHRETELCDLWSATNTCKNLHVLNPLQVHENNIEQNKIKDDNELEQNSSVTPLNRDLFQMEVLSHRSVSDKRWRQYQLSQVPFSCGTGSVLSHVEYKKNVFPEKVCNTENKDYYSNSHKTTIDNKEKNNSSHLIPKSKPFKSIRPLEIPKFLMKENTFQFPSFANKISHEMSSVNLKEMNQKTLKCQATLMQSKQIHGVQKVSEVGNQKSQADKNIMKASAVGSDFEEKNYQSVSKQEYSALAEGGKLSVTYFRDESTDPLCNQIFAESDFKVLENSDDDDDDQRSRIHIYVSAKEVQNKTFMSSMDIMKRMERKSSHENMTTFHIQTSNPAITEALEKNKLDMRYGLHNSSSDTSLQEAKSKLFTKEILDIKRNLTKNVTLESNCTPIIVHNFPDTKVSFNVVSRKKTFKLSFSFQIFLFGALRSWTESLPKDIRVHQAENIIHWFDFHETFSKQCDTRGLVNSSISRRHNNKTFFCLLAVISKHLKVKLLKTILASIFNKKNALLPTEGKFARAEKHPSFGRKQMQLNSCIESNLRQNKDFYKKCETYPSILSSNFMDRISFELRNKCQKRHFSKSLGDEKSTFLNRGIFFHNQKSGSLKGRGAGKHQFLSRGSERFLSMYLESVTHRKDMKKQISVAKCLILLQGNCDHSSLRNMHCYNIKKIQNLIRTNLRFLSYLPAYSQLKFEKVKNKCSNQQISVTTIKWAKKKPREMFNSCFHGERLTALPFILSDNKTQKTGVCRNSRKSANEIIYKMKNHLGTFNYIKADRKQYFKSKELQISSYNILSKKSLPLFDTHKKIPLISDSEDFDQIPLIYQNNSDKKTAEQNTVIDSENIHNSPDKTKAVSILPEQSKTTMEKCNSLLLQDSQTSKPEYCKEIDTYILHLVNEKEFVEFPNTHLNSGNIFSSFSSEYLYITSPLQSNYFVKKNRVLSEDGHYWSSSSAVKQGQCEKIHTTIPYLATGSPTVTFAYLQLQANEAGYFSLQRHAQTNKAISLKSATLQQHLEYVKEQEEISGEQMHVTNESQCETVMNGLIMSHSENESKTLFSPKEKLKMHLSVMNNGCLEDVKDEYLPSENKITYEFELKRKFDLVLEELHMFHEISKRDENSLSSVETNSHNNYCELNNSEGIEENMESVSDKKTCVSSPVCGTIEGQNITDSSRSSLNEEMSLKNEHLEVHKEYCISRLSSEELLQSPIAEVYKKPYTWDPAFLSFTLWKEENYNLQKEGGYLGYFLSHELTRVQPLKTCKGPIRIGLSRKARPQKLHPYLK